MVASLTLLNEWQGQTIHILFWWADVPSGMSQRHKEALAKLSLIKIWVQTSVFLVSPKKAAISPSPTSKIHSRFYVGIEQRVHFVRLSSYVKNKICRNVCVSLTMKCRKNGFFLAENKGILECEWVCKFTDKVWRARAPTWYQQLPLGKEGRLGGRLVLS